MIDFIYNYSMERNNKRINHDLFNRTNKFDKPLHLFVVETCKHLEVIPNIKLVDWELITDQSQINLSLDKRLIKDKRIKNNKYIDKVISLNNTLSDLLRITFEKNINGKRTRVTRDMLVFKKLDSGEYYINGSKALPLNQVTDNSTFVKSDVVRYKAALFGIDVYKKPIILEFTDNDNIKTNKFVLKLFERNTNPLLYFFAQFGLNHTLYQFDLEKVISVVPEVIDKDRYKYIMINKSCYIEVNKEALEDHIFVSEFVGSMVDLFEKKIKIKNVYDEEYWLTVLAQQFSKKTPDKGKRTLMSFNKVIDQTTRHRLSFILPKYHIRNTHSLIRWIMTNHNELLSKDNHDLNNKRIRTNEAIAYYFDAYVTKSLNSVLNSDNITEDTIDRLLNTISINSLSRALYSNKENKYSLFVYESYNDLSAINLSRYTFKGPGGLNGGKYKTSLKYRDIYPSHLNVFDLNVCAPSDPGLTGYLCANVKINDGGYFGVNSEPDNYIDDIKDTLDNIIIEKDYIKSREMIIKQFLSKDKNGNYVLKRKEFVLDGRYLPGYANYTTGGYGLIRKGLLDKNGNFKLVRKNKKEIDVHRNQKGEILLIRKDNSNKR